MRAGWVLMTMCLLWSCESGSPWEGRYEGTGPPPAAGVTLTLQPGGKGSWNVEQETTPLRWEERSGSVWLHLKSGGTIAARPIPGEQALLLELPGVGTVKLHRE